MIKIDKANILILCYNNNHNIMLDIEILAIGKIKAKYIKEGILEYEKRLKPFAWVQTIELPAVAFNSSNKNKAKKEEGELISQYLAKRPNAHIIFLEEKGKTFDSVEWAGFLNKISQKIIFVLGGSLGIDSKINIKPDIILSLSKLTFSHELARLVLFEQIYRAATIINNKDYHY